MPKCRQHNLFGAEMSALHQTLTRCKNYIVRREDTGSPHRMHRTQTWACSSLTRFFLFLRPPAFLSGCFKPLKTLRRHYGGVHPVKKHFRVLALQNGRWFYWTCHKNFLHEIRCCNAYLTYSASPTMSISPSHWLRSPPAA